MTDKQALEVLKSWLQLAYHNADGTDECCAELYEALQNVFALITRQQEEIEALVAGQETLQKYIAKAKAEAVKEFAERLSNEAQIADNFDSYNMVVGIHFIDNLLKEMVGEIK